MTGIPTSYKAIFFLAILILINSLECTNISTQKKINNNNDQQEVVSDQNNYIINDDTSNNDLTSEDIKGKIIPNIDDTTLLRLVYGKYSYSDITHKFCFNYGPEDRYTSMQVEECLGDSSTKIIYLRGVITMSNIEHSYSNETALILNKTKSGWIIMDSYINQSTADFVSVELKGIYNDEFLVEYNTGGMYGHGIQYSQLNYFLIKRKSFTKPALDFLMRYDNSECDQCQCGEVIHYTDKYCYSNIADLNYSFNESLKCLVFEYKLIKKTAECDWKNIETKLAYQQWYMNADISFQSKGNLISSWAEDIDDSISSLTEIEIRHRLGFEK